MKNEYSKREWPTSLYFLFKMEIVGVNVASAFETKNDRELRLLEAVCVQHEIDHLNGIVCMDRKIETTIKRTEKKIGRNELVTLKKGDAVKVLKYKKAQNFLNDGWAMQ